MKFLGCVFLLFHFNCGLNINYFLNIGNEFKYFKNTFQAKLTHLQATYGPRAASLQALMNDDAQGSGPQAKKSEQ